MKLLHSALRSALSVAFAAAALLVVNLDTRLCGTAELGQTAFNPPEVRAASDGAGIADGTMIPKEKALLVNRWQSLQWHV